MSDPNKSQDFNADEVLNNAMNNDISSLIVIGIKRDGATYYASNLNSEREVVDMALDFISFIRESEQDTFPLVSETEEVNV